MPRSGPLYKSATASSGIVGPSERRTCADLLSRNQCSGPHFRGHSSPLETMWLDSLKRKLFTCQVKRRGPGCDLLPEFRLSFHAVEDSLLSCLIILHRTLVMIHPFSFSFLPCPLFLNRSFRHCRRDWTVIRRFASWRSSWRFRVLIAMPESVETRTFASSAFALVRLPLKDKATESE